MMQSISSFGNLRTSSGVSSFLRPWPSVCRYCGITCATAIVFLTVIVELISILMSPLRSEKYFAVTSSVHPNISWMSQLPIISDHRLFGYRFCSWPRLCTASMTRISLERMTLKDLAKSDPSSAPPIRPTLLNSSSMRLTGTSQRPSLQLSA